MSTTYLRNALLQTTAHRLGDVIDWVERPWAPCNNDTLRRLWHEARRDHAAHPALAFALEQEVQNLGARDLDHVASRLGCVPSTGGVAIAITQRLGGCVPEPARVPSDAIATAFGALVQIASAFASAQPPRGRRGRRYGHRRG
jgi:hypothetical protein